VLRFVALAAFLVAVAVVLALADVSAGVVVGVMATAWVIAAAVEWFSWREDSRQSRATHGEYAPLGRGRKREADELPTVVREPPRLPDAAEPVELTWTELAPTGAEWPFEAAPPGTRSAAPEPTPAEEPDEQALEGAIVAEPLRAAAVEVESGPAAPAEPPAAPAEEEAAALTIVARIQAATRRPGPREAATAEPAPSGEPPPAPAAAESAPGTEDDRAIDVGGPAAARAGAEALAPEPLEAQDAELGPAEEAGPQAWNIWELERRAREAGRAHPDRAGEWSALFVHLREYADADGTLPEAFDALVRESFADLLGLSRRG
jgi:hypothetical protein